MEWAARTTGIWFLLVTLIETSLYFRLEKCYFAILLEVNIAVP